MGEMIDDVMEDALGGDDDLEEEANEEIDKLLYEITAGSMTSLSTPLYPLSRSLSFLFPLSRDIRMSPQ